MKEAAPRWAAGSVVPVEVSQARLQLLGELRRAQLGKGDSVRTGARGSRLKVSAGPSPPSSQLKVLGKSLSPRICNGKQCCRFHTIVKKV